MTSASPDVIRTARYFFHGFLSMTAPAKYIAINPSPDTTPPWTLFHNITSGGNIQMRFLCFPLLVLSRIYKKILKNKKLNSWQRTKLELSFRNNARNIPINIKDEGRACFCNLWVLTTNTEVKNITAAWKATRPNGPRCFIKK